MANVDWAKYYMDVVERVEQTNELLAWVVTHYKVGLLTNIMPGVLDLLRESKLVPDVRYDAVVDSSVVGAVKPEPKIYEVAEQLAQVKPEEILFVDDSRVNLTAADKLGWHVMWFDASHAKESVERVKTALELA
jgi:epoxide hydrolase-like predicted phosphatase